MFQRFSKFCFFFLNSYFKDFRRIQRKEKEKKVRDWTKYFAEKATKLDKKAARLGKEGARLDNQKGLTYFFSGWNKKNSQLIHLKTPGMQSFPKKNNAVFCKPASGLTFSHQTKSTFLDKMSPLGTMTH